MKRAAAVLVALTWLGIAQAEPLDRWDKAREPAAEKRERVLEEALALSEQASATRRSEARKDLFRSARSMLEGIDAAHSPDVRFRFALGEAVHRLDDDAGTIAVLAPAVLLAPEHPGTGRALLALAIAYARSGRSAEEIDVYDRMMPNAGEQRILILGNRAEAKLRLFDFAGAITDYEQAIHLAPNHPSAYWGLGVTLDRTGDFGRALVSIKEAHDLDLLSARGRYLDSSEVFFVPAYEKEWYLALEEAMMGSQVDRALADRRDSWLEARAHWDTYAARATKDDRWIPLARARRKQCDAAIARLEREIKKRPRGPASDPGRDGPFGR